MKKIFTACLMMLGTIANAQPTEERLSLCINRGLETVTYAKAWKKSLESIGKPVEAAEFAYLVTSSSVIADQLLDMLEAEEQNQVILETLKNITETNSIQRRLVTDMVEEAFEGQSNFFAMAEFIA